MRLLEVKIELVDKKESETIGNDAKSGRARHTIDLDCVESVRDGEPDNCAPDGIVIYFKSGENVWTDSYNLDEFVSLWKGESKPSNLNIETEIDKLIGGIK